MTIPICQNVINDPSQKHEANKPRANFKNNFMLRCSFPTVISLDAIRRRQNITQQDESAKDVNNYTHTMPDALRLKYALTENQGKRPTGSGTF